MRVAFFIVSVFVLATPSHASVSCMSMAEARQNFRTSYVY